MASASDIERATRAEMDADIEETGGKRTLYSKVWRMKHLYRVRPPQGGEPVVFSPQPEQIRFYRKLQTCRRVVWLKPRGIGGTAAVAVDVCDDVFSHKGFNAVVVVNTIDRGQEVFSDIYQTIYRNPVLHDVFPPLMPGSEDSQYSLVFGPGWGISIVVKMVAGTYQYVHSSELGQQSFENPSRAREFRTQGLPTLRDPSCKIVVESTARGTVGVFREMWDTAVRTDAEIDAGTRQRDPLDWGAIFGCWYLDPKKVRATPYPITKADADYFSLKQELTKHVFTDQQKWWYCWQLHDEAKSPEDMHANFPTDPEEAFAASTEGLVFARELAEAYRDGRIGSFKYDRRYPVNTAWDYGTRGHTAIVHFQDIGNLYHVIDYDEGQDQSGDVYISMLRQKPWHDRYGVHFGPHDVNTRDRWTNKTIMESAAAFGFRFTAVDRCRTKEEAHDAMRAAFPRFRFDREGASALLDRLNGYRKRWSKQAQNWSGVIDDDNCHGADACMQIAQQYEMIRDRTKPFKVRVQQAPCVLG